jgi:hypothetical protein
MRRSVRRTTLLMAGVLCLIAQSVAAVPVCRCGDTEGSAPCHRESAPARSTCCSEEPGPATAGGCTTDVQAPCCQGAMPAAEAQRALVPVVDSGVDVSATQPAVGPVEAVRSAPRPHRHSVEPPAPPGAPVWLRHAALLN